MTNAKTTRSALISCVVSLLLCVSMLVGTTFAWFTDSVTSGNNVIAAGNLDIVLEYWDGTAWVDAEGKVLDFVKADNSGDTVLWEPGCTYQLPKIRVRNEGSLAAKVLIRLNGVTGNEKLMEVIDLTTTVSNIPESILTGSQASIYNQFNNATYGVMFGTPDGSIIFDWTVMGKGVVSPNSGHTDTSAEFTIAGHMDENAGNEYQGLSIEGVSITVLATQSVYEYDSFGREYDNSSPFPDAATGNIGAGESIATRSGVSVKLPDTAADANYTLKTDNIKVETNDAGEKSLSLNIELFENGAKAQSGPYTVSIDMGAEVVVTGVMHNGEAVTDYTFDPITHILTFTTDSFSPFEVTYSDKTYSIKTVEELQAVLGEIKASAKEQIPGAEGNKNYRENAIFVLEEDLVIDSTTEFMYTDSNGAPLHFYGVKGILDLNGHNITVTEDALLSGKTFANGALLIQYSNIDIIGEGSIIANNQSSAVYAWANCTVNIYGGTYGGNGHDRDVSAVYVNNASVMVNVFGGNYTDCKYAFNAHDNCGSTPVITLHEGITYNDYLKGGKTDVIQADLNAGRIVIAEGLEIVKSDGKNTVVAK